MPSAATVTCTRTPTPLGPPCSQLTATASRSGMCPEAAAADPLRPGPAGRPAGQRRQVRPWEEGRRASWRLGPPLPEAAATLRGRGGLGTRSRREGRAQLPDASRPLPRLSQALVPALSAAVCRARPHAPAARRPPPTGRAAAASEPCCPSRATTRNRTPLHRKCLAEKPPPARDVVRKPQSRARWGGPDGGAAHARLCSERRLWAWATHGRTWSVWPCTPAQLGWS